MNSSPPHLPVPGVENLPLGSLAEQITEDVGSGHQSIPTREPFGDLVAVTRILVLVASVLRTKLVEFVIGDDPGVLAGKIPVVPVELLTVRNIPHAADPEVVLPYCS